MKEKFEGHPGKRRIPSGILYILGSAFYRIFFNVRIEGTENIPNEGPLLILSKHSSYHDIPLGYSVLTRASGKRNDFWCVMKDALASPIFMGFFLKCGGVPINRENPEKSKSQLILARKVLHAGNMLGIFPEQTRVPGKMGRGKEAGFRFVMGKPKEKVAVVCLGISYEKGFLRKKATLKIGKVHFFQSGMDASQFFHERMVEMGELSGFSYNFPPPKKKEGTGNETTKSSV
ncbi:MAG: 1-acyl-sn-glycerol-3-phosphate acyltransferase [Leptospiraceae bacterium]|nr:1-acyl-sn-glycerol-3-phosphate acyltransferase [Leptospiraceae bacterium]MCP5500413.1 1-acyl-sn-glycerol-3-phosphate acyltransferase [Leptospiraceae bacterium]